MTNKFDNYPVSVLKSVITDFYSEDEVISAKQLLTQSIDSSHHSTLNTHLRKRIGDNKLTRRPHWHKLLTWRRTTQIKHVGLLYTSESMQRRHVPYDGAKWGGSSTVVFPPQVTSLTAAVGLAILWASKFLCGKKFISFLVTYRLKNTAQYVVRTLSHLQCWCPLNMAGLYLYGLSEVHSCILLQITDRIP